MILKICLAVSVVLLAISLYYCIKFALIILRVQDTIEESLDILDQKYSTMSEILSRPLFFDSAEVRNVLDDISASRDAVHKIAVSLTKNFEQERQNER